MSETLMQATGTITMVARDAVVLRRRVNEQERAMGAVMREVPAPRLRRRVHAFVRHDGEVVGCAVIRPRLRGGWVVRFGRAVEVKP